MDRAQILKHVIATLAARLGEPVGAFRDSDDLRTRWHFTDASLRDWGAALETGPWGRIEIPPAQIASCRTIADVVALLMLLAQQQQQQQLQQQGSERESLDWLYRGNDRSSGAAGTAKTLNGGRRWAQLQARFDEIRGVLPATAGAAAEPQATAEPRQLIGQRADAVEMAAYAPKTCAPGGTVLVQAILHQAADADAARALAVEADADATRRGVQTLALPLTRGDRVTVDIDVAGVTIEEPRQEAVWNGVPINIQFFVPVPADRSTPLAVRLTASRDSVPVGTIRFLLPVQAGAAPSFQAGAAPSFQDGAAPSTPEPRGEAVRFSRAFISYTTADRPDVLERVQMLDLAGITVFQDVLSLEPGERWEKKLYEKIAEADLFVLFWSPQSSQSKWVLKEALYALECGTRPPGERPHIMPVVLGGLPMPSVPAELKAIHFNDKFNYLIVGARAEAGRRRATRDPSAPPPAGP